MADQLDALLGLDIKSEDEARALASQLRDEQSFERYFSETSNPTVNKNAQNRLEAIRKTAANVGKQRYTAGRDVIGDARNVATDKRADETLGLTRARDQFAKDKYGDTQSALGGFEPWLDATDTPMNVRRTVQGEYLDVDGNPVNMRGATRDPNAVTDKGYIPADRGSSGVNEIKVKVNNVDYIYDKAARKLYTTMGEEVTDPNIIAQVTQRETDAARMGKFREKEGTDAAAALTDDIKGWNAKTKAVDAYRSILTLLESDEANTGQVYKQTPTFKAATGALESLTEELTLGALDQYQLKPVSDIDIKVLRNSVLPTDLQAPDLAKWVAHKIEATNRYLEYEDRILRWKSENAGKRMSEAEKATFDEIRDEIIYAGGFDPFDPLGGAPKAGAGGGSSDVGSIRAQITDPAELAKFDEAMRNR